VENLDLQAPPDPLDHPFHRDIQGSLDREAHQDQWAHQEDEAEQGKMGNLYDYFLYFFSV